MTFLITLIVISILQSEHTIIFSSFAASIFLIVAMPTNDTVKIQNVIGGHLIGFVSGGIIAVIMSHYAFNPILAYAISVGLATLFMSIFEILHPPAAGTALGVVMIDVSLNVLVSILTTTCILGIVTYIIQKNYLRLVYK